MCGQFWEINLYLVNKHSSEVIRQSGQQKIKAKKIIHIIVSDLASPVQSSPFFQIPTSIAAIFGYINKMAILLKH